MIVKIIMFRIISYISGKTRMSSQRVGSSRVLQTLLDKLDIFEEMEDVKREQYIERHIDKLDKFTVYINS